MKNSTNWVIGCVVAILLVCLCLLCVVGGASIVSLDSLHSFSQTQTAEFLSGGVTVFPSEEAATRRPPNGTSVAEGTLLPSGSLPVFDPPPAGAFVTRQNLEQVDPPGNDLIELAARLKGIPNIPRVVATSAAPVAVGASDHFYITNMDDNSVSTITATMRYATAHVYFWVETGVSANLTEIKTLVDRFEEKTYPTDREFFGSEWTPGVDGDAHLYILYAGGLGSSVGGYYGSNDEYPLAASGYSNQHEMFYINADTAGLTEDFTGGILAHEFQHMIHWKGDPNEESWLNEGFSELAAFLNLFDMGGFDAEYARNTDLPLTYWPDINDDTSVSHYGGSFLFTDYFLNQFGEDATKALIRNPENGLKSVDDTLRSINATDPASGRVLTADDVITGFAAALYLNNSSLENGRFAFANYPGVPKASVTERITTCPTGAEERSVSQYGIDYIQISCTGPLRVNFSGETTQAVLPADPAEGSFYAWSNRGDESDMTLTRSFDLPAGTATFDYKIWYDIEQDYDYAYLEISTDGGATWKFLHTPSGTSANPQGANYGWGWTGTSGGGNTAEWLDESVDLSAYAGQSVILRFEYITDPAVNGEGLMVDDIRIPELNYSTGFEDDFGGWESAGFPRIDNILPQTFRVLLIRTGGQPSVEEIILDDRMTGGIDVNLKSGEKAVIAVLGTTRHTTQKATYYYEIVPQ